MESLQRYWFIIHYLVDTFLKEVSHGVFPEDIKSDYFPSFKPLNVFTFLASNNDGWLLSDYKLVSL